MKLDLKKFFGQIKNTKVLCIIFILGIVLLMLPTGSNSKKTETEVLENSGFSEYKKELEENLTSIISKIKGVGKVDVMITFLDEGSTYFAKNENISYKEGENETTKTNDSTYVLKSEASSKESPLITKKTSPEISGVLICAQGAQNPQIKNNITMAVEALLGVKSHRVEVLERN